MDLDVGCVTENPGTAKGVPGTAEEVSGTYPVISEEHLSAEPMEIDEPVPLCMICPAPKWAQAIMSYMEDGSLPDDEVLARQV